MTKEEKRKNSIYRLAYLYVCDEDKVISRTPSENTYQDILSNQKAGDNSIFRRLTKTPTETNQKHIDDLLKSLHKDSKIETFKDLEKALPENRVEQIKKSNRNLPVLIIGGNCELVNGIVSYFQFTHPVINLKGDNNSPEYISSLFEATLKGYTGRIRFQEVDYTGRPEGYIHEDIESKLEHYFNGGMLFLRGIEGKFSGVFKFLASKANNRTERKGVLIINTDGTNNLPQDFKGQFEPIYLEPEPQDTPVSTPQTQGKTKDVLPFPTPTGTQWHEVNICFIDSENVKISARDKTETKHFFDMGFRKGKTCKPVKSWHTLFAFSEKRCLTYSQSIKSKTEKDIQDLRKRLKAYFGIQDDPIILKHGYEPVFKVCRSESEGENRSIHAYSNSPLFDEKKDD